MIFYMSTTSKGFFDSIKEHGVEKLSHIILMNMIPFLLEEDIEGFSGCINEIQKIGFKNVEWIIVMHNCEKEYINKVTDMYKNDENVKIKIFNNDRHTPGSPRNEGFKYIESQYLIFLDSDDSFSLDCLEKVVWEMDNTNADMLRFRMEAIAVDKGVEAVSILSDANATYERIICVKGDWNLDAMFSGYFGCCATQVYKVDFLRKNNIFILLTKKSICCSL